MCTPEQRWEASVTQIISRGGKGERGWKRNRGGGGVAAEQFGRQTRFLTPHLAESAPGRVARTTAGCQRGDWKNRF